MDIRRSSRVALQNSADALETAARRIKRSANRVADTASDAADDAWRGISRAGREVTSFARRRPVETAVIVGLAGLLIGSLFAYRRYYRDED